MKKTFITVAIPAYNEPNIKELLLSVVKQKEMGYIIQEILLISDGSTDNTVTLAKQVKDKRIKIFNNKIRKGKSFHLNTIFRLAKGEIIVLFDADVTLYDRNTIFNLIAPFSKNSHIKLTGGFSEQKPSRNFMEACVEISNKFFHKVRAQIKNGNNIYTCIGQVLAIKNDFAKTIMVPANVLCNDSFLYLTCLKRGHQFIHVPDAKVWYRSPNNIKDHYRQSNRFNEAKKRLAEYFENLAISEIEVPRVLYIKFGLLTAIRYPLHTIALKILDFHRSKIIKTNGSKIKGTWPMALSTKKTIVYE